MTKSMFLIATGLLASVASVSQAQAAPVIGAPIVVYSTGNVFATFLGSAASYKSQLGLVGGPNNIFYNKTTAIGTTYNLGTYAAGTVLTFSLNVLSTGKTYFSGAAALNPDHFAYGAVSTVGNVSTVGFEDIFKGGDRDYNDFNFSVTSTGTSTPEPAAWALMIAGFGFVGAAMRQRKRVTVSYA